MKRARISIDNLERIAGTTTFAQVEALGLRCEFRQTDMLDRLKEAFEKDAAVFTKTVGFSFEAKAEIYALGMEGQLLALSAVATALRQVQA
jgi:hypothetical protein